MSLKQDLDSTPVSRLNVRPPLTISASATVREAVQLMRTKKLGCVVVVDENDRAVGLFTEAMLRHGLNQSAALLDDTMQNQMATRFPWVLPVDSARDILDAMEDFDTRFLAVLNNERHVTGITGQKTLIEFVAESFPREILTQDPTGHSVMDQKEGA